MAMDQILKNIVAPCNWLFRSDFEQNNQPNSKLYPTSIFHPMSAKLHEDIGYQGGIQAIFHGNGSNLKKKKLSHFAILTCESIRKW